MMRRTLQQLGFLIVLSALCSSAGAESLIAKLLRVAGLTAAPGEMRGPDGGARGSGDIWTVNANGSGRIALTSGGGYRSPIFAPAGDYIYALKADTLMRIPAGGGAAQAMLTAAGVIKLVGVDGSNANALIVLTDRGSAPLSELSLSDGKIVALAPDANTGAEQMLLTQIRGDDRTYRNAKLYLHTETKRGISREIEWTDVYLRRGSQPSMNVSACDGVNCMQPALSPDGRRVAFVKADD